MRSDDYQAFSGIIGDLCVAFDRQVTDARVRVFYEALKSQHIADVKRMAEAWKRSGRRMPAPKDLMPERATASAPKPPSEQDQEVAAYSRWAVAANKILFAVAYLDKQRGFRPIGRHSPMPPGGFGLPLRLVKALDDTKLTAVLAVKRDYVRMAEEAEARGDVWDHIEFNRMCREGFQAVIA